MALPAVTTAALLSAPLVVLLFLFGHMATSAPTELCLEGCICYNDMRNEKLKTINCTSFRPILTAASSLLSDFSHVDVLNIQDVVDGSSDFIIDGLFGVFSKVKYMNLINASISKIDPNAFKGLKRLEELDLSKNHIYKFRPETFSDTPNLKLLDLSYNPLRLAPTTFLISKSLEYLILSSCNLTSIPAGSFKGLPNLKTLDLYNNQIQSFTFRSFPRSLNRLLLTKNNLINIPTKALSSLNKLTRLDLSENPVNCTCSLIGLQDWLSAKGIEFENDVICRYPSAYNGENWKYVIENEICFGTEGDNLIPKKEDISESSCENEICDESTVEDRYIYNAVQADQPITELVTEDTIKDVDIKIAEEPMTTTTSINEGKETVDDISNIPKIESITENNADGSDAANDSLMNESKNLVEDDHTTEENITEEPKTDESVGESQNDSTNNSLLDTTESSNDQDVTTQSIFSTESEVEPSNSPPSVVIESTTASLEIQTTSFPQTPETTTLKPNENTPEARQIMTEETTKQFDVTGTSTEENIVDPTTLPEVKSTTEAIVQEDAVTGVTVTTEATLTTTPVTIESTSETSDHSSTVRSEESVSVVGNSETTTVLPITTTTLSKAMDDDISPSTSSSEIITSTASSIVLDENKESTSKTTTPIETTTNGIIPFVPTSEKTNYVPNSIEETKEIFSTMKAFEVGQGYKMEPTKNTEGINVLPSTDNREGKMLPSENSEQKPESMGSYIVLAGIIIVLLLLILYATTKKSKKSSNKKTPLQQDAENNMTELQDMTTLLPSSPVANGNKNNKYPNEEPSVTAKLLEADDQPDPNGNGYAYPPESKTDKAETPEKVQGSKDKSTLPRTNGSNGAPPLELTKAKVVVMHDSLPRTPIYIQKSVNS